MADKLPLRSALEVARGRLREFDERIANQEALLARLAPGGRPFLVAEAQNVLAVTRALRDEAAARVAELEGEPETGHGGK